MIKTLFVRLSGLVLASFAFAPAVTAILKGEPPVVSRFFNNLYVPLWWWRWVWKWMPAVRLPIETWADLISSLPGIFAIGFVTVGTVVAFGTGNDGAARRWEGRP